MTEGGPRPAVGIVTIGTGTGTVTIPSPCILLAIGSSRVHNGAGKVGHHCTVASYLMGGAVHESSIDGRSDCGKYEMESTHSDVPVGVIKLSLVSMKCMLIEHL